MKLTKEGAEKLIDKFIGTYFKGLAMILITVLTTFVGTAGLIAISVTNIEKRFDSLEVKLENLQETIDGRD